MSVAFTREESAETATAIVRQKLYLLDVLRKRMNFHKIEPAIVHMKEKYNAGAVILKFQALARQLETLS